jgi:2-methylcitrate dehydratase PrpD
MCRFDSDETTAFYCEVSYDALRIRSLGEVTVIRREFCKASMFAVAAAGVPVRMAERAVAGAANETTPLPKSPGLTKYVADFIVDTKYENIPQDVVELGKKTILDGFGLALTGSVSESGPIIREYIDSIGLAGGKASVIGTGMKVPARFAALANGIALHADDFDDTGSALHVNAPMLPAALALCELEHRSGKDFTVAYHLGVEVEDKIGDAISARHNADGFHTTGTCGSFGSAAACAKLRGLNATQTLRALGIAGSQASGLRDNFGTMTKPFHAGHAAESGVVAADLASMGWTAAEDILEAPLGFYQAEGGTYDPRAIVDRLGKPWMFASPGDLIKRFPCGTIQQAVMDEVLRLIRENKIQAADVESIEVGGNQSNLNTLFRHRPKTALEAKFSMEFSVAVLLVEGKAGLNEFTDAVVQKPAVQDMIARTRFYVDPEFDKPGQSFQATLTAGNVIKIRMKDGRVVTGRSGHAKGSPENPMSYEEVAEKFRGNADFVKWPTQKGESVIEMVKSLETLADMNKLTAALTT